MEGAAKKAAVVSDGEDSLNELNDDNTKDNRAKEEMCMGGR